MARVQLSSIVLAALVLFGTSVTAQAQQKAKSAPSATTSFSSREIETPQDLNSPTAVRKTWQWDAKTGKWGFRVDVDQPTNRDAHLKEAEVGAFYRLTPSLRVGGAVGVTGPAVTQKPIVQDPNQPRVRLETALKF